MQIHLATTPEPHAGVESHGTRKLDAADAPSRENLQAAFNNWALAECDAGRFESAVTLVVSGLAEHPDYGPLLANDLHIHRRWALALCAAEDFAKALEILDTAYQRRPQVELFDQGRRAVYQQWSTALTNEGAGPAASQQWREAGRRLDEAR